MVTLQPWNWIGGCGCILPFAHTVSLDANLSQSQKQKHYYCRAANIGIYKQIRKKIYFNEEDSSEASEL